MKLRKKTLPGSLPAEKILQKQRHEAQNAASNQMLVKNEIQNPQTPGQCKPYQSYFTFKQMICQEKLRKEKQKNFKDFVTDVQRRTNRIASGGDTQFAENKADVWEKPFSAKIPYQCGMLAFRGGKWYSLKELFNLVKGEG